LILFLLWDQKDRLLLLPPLDPFRLLHQFLWGRLHLWDLHILSHPRNLSGLIHRLHLCLLLNLWGRCLLSHRLYR